VIRVSANTQQTQRLLRNLQTMPRATKKVTSQELNRQMRTSVSGTGNSSILPVIGMARRMSRSWGISQKRIRSRIFVPRGGFANPNKLIAIGLTLFEALPMRYFSKGVPSGGVVKQTTEPDSQGRVPYGGAFTATLKSGAKGKMRKLKPQKWGASGARNPEPKGYLPIGWAEYVDVRVPALNIRAAVLADLARYWPSQMDRALRKLIKRRFG